MPEQNTQKNLSNIFSEKVLLRFLQQQAVDIHALTLVEEPDIKTLRESEELDTAALQAAKSGQLDKAISLARQSIALGPMRVEAYYHLGSFFYLKGDNELAENFLKVCTWLQPYFDPAYECLANLYLKLGQLEKALEISICLEKNFPGLADNRFRIGTIYLRIGCFDDARQWFDLGLNSPVSQSQTRLLPYGTVTVPRLHHDIKQLDWMLRKRLLSPVYYQVIAAYRKALAASPYSEQSNVWAESHEWQLDARAVTELSLFYRRCLHLTHTSSVKFAINPELDFQTIEKTYLTSPEPYRIVVLDNLLTSEALNLLLRYCLESTIWHNDNQKGRNYLGAYQNSGFYFPLLEKITTDIKLLFPKIFAGEEISQVWAYKSVIGETAIGAHADFARINVNFWITPDESNRNPDTGGMVIYKKVAPLEWKFEDYNDNDDRIHREIMNSESIRVPYRQNRAVIFDSRLFHKSDLIDFNDRYEDMRINVTLLYGDRKA